MSLSEAIIFIRDGYGHGDRPPPRPKPKPRSASITPVPKPPKASKYPTRVKRKRSSVRISRTGSLWKFHSYVGDLKNHVPSSAPSIFEESEPLNPERSETYSEIDKESLGPIKRNFSPWRPFEYSELPPDHIRLIRFKPTPFYAPGGIAFDLVIVPLDKHPPYDALSYRWEGANEKVSCSGGTLAVSSNCKSALKQLNKEDKLLWVDAICINQRDGIEKNHQVGLMSRIYSQAECTIAWLGEDQDLGASCLALINEAIRLGRFNDFENFAKSSSSYKASLVATMELDLLETLKPFAKLLRRDWFSRIWILQEVALANKISIKCGSETTPWPKFMAVIKKLKNNDNFSANCRAALNLDTFRGQYRWKGGIDVHAAMVQARHCHASDPRDKIYALLGVCPDLASAMGEPDYELPVSFVWTRAQRACLTGPLSINALSLVSVGERLEKNVPSWVPDLSTGLKTWPRRPPTPVASDGTPWINPCSGNDSSCLHIQGTFVDTLQTKSEFVHITTFDQIRTQWRDWWFECRINPWQLGDYHPETIRSFWGTLLCDFNNSMPRTDVLLSWHQLTLASSVNKMSSSTPFSHRIRASDFVETTLDRIFGMTEQSTIGLFPKNAQVGDRIVLFSGGSSPYLIRPTFQSLGTYDRQKRTYTRHSCNGFELVGPCYMWGLADEKTRATKHAQGSEEIVLF